VSARDDILGALRRNRPAARPPLPEIPAYRSAAAEDRLERFGRLLGSFGGTLLRADPTEDPLAPARIRIAGAAGPVCSAVPALPGDRALRPGLPPASFADIDLAILPARFGIAETGSVALTGRELVVNSLGYLAQHLLVLLDPEDILDNLHEAYGRPDFRHAPYLVLQTGPSATADIEGVLIRGAQGARSLTVVLAPAACFRGEPSA